MTPNPPKPPRVFISYSWSSQDHQARILDWAERLVGNGIDVVLDKWNLKEGQDKFHFMEQMVKDTEVSKVLVFSDKAYAEKADARKGGVGTESQIISKEVYDQVAQEKFLPIVCERNANCEPYLPVFLQSRIYFDFSSPESFHENYEKLVRAIFDKPLHKKPALGKPPEYILADDRLHVWSRPLLESFKEAVLRDQKSYLGHAATFLETFADRLEELRLSPQQGMDFDEQVIASIDSFLPFRNDFIEFVRVVAVYRNERELYERIGDFLERLIRYKHSVKPTPVPNDAWCDNIRFILYELVLYVTALLLKNRRLDELLILTDRRYILADASPHPDIQSVSFTQCSDYCQSLLIRSQRLGQGRVSPMADLVKARAITKPEGFEELMQADAMLLLKSLLSDQFEHHWYSQVLIYYSVIWIDYTI